MTVDAFTSLLKHPSHLSAEHQEQLKTVIATYPFFQSARAMYLKALKDHGSFKYNHALKTTAAHTTDRSILFDYITSEVFQQNEISKQIKQNQSYINEIELHEFEDISVQKSVLLDDQLRHQIQESEAVLDPELFTSKDPEIAPETTAPADIITVAHQDKSPEETLQIGKPLEFDKTEVHSFTEWLKITSFKPIIRDEAPEETTPSPEEKDDNKVHLIDKFLASNPKMPEVDKKQKKKNIAKERMLPQETLMTETLARIYVEQKNYEKAIQAYRILSLKYPEKSGFFADQIKAVRQIIEQNKTSDE